MPIEWGPVIGAAIGAAGSLLGGGGGGGREREQRSEPRWAPQQLPYLFGSQAWQPQMPLFNPYAVNYAGALMAGYNPAFGPQQPMGGMPGMGGYGMPGMGGTGGYGMQNAMPPWYQDPNATPQYGGFPGLLGFGYGAPPPTLMNSPFFGHQVQSPELLHQPPGGQVQTGGGQQQAPPEPQRPDTLKLLPYGGPGGGTYDQKANFLRLVYGMTPDQLTPDELLRMQSEPRTPYRSIFGGNRQFPGREY